VGSEHLSNGKRKGRGTTKKGNCYLAWAYIEAANFAVRYNATIKRYYQRKCARTHRVVAIETVAHKLARACYYICATRCPSTCTRPSADSIGHGLRRRAGNGVGSQPRDLISRRRIPTPASWSEGFWTGVPLS
jgi:hypothetical protein